MYRTESKLFMLEAILQFITHETIKKKPSKVKKP